MIVALMTIFFSALGVGFLGKYISKRWFWIISLIPLLVFLYFAQFLPKISSFEKLTESYSWVPSLHVSLNFYLDGLSLLFALLISGIGFLVFLYTSNYLKEHPLLHRFYSYLLLFMGAMLGLVLADNILLLFVFWELTSISSFFLIGFNNEDADSRKSAFIALTITGIGGLFLLVSLLLLGNTTGTYSISTLLESPAIFKDGTIYYVIVVCLFIAAWTKSAQFPFHFWLPGAMDAPTPVSTYLHSATMVKAGIFILLRFTPVLGGTSFWSISLLIVGGITMLYAALQIFFKTDLKNILAYSTIAALGVLVFLTGIGTSEALLAAVFFIVVHALYKATLFLIVGIIDYSTGSRDSTKLYGLAKYLLPASIAGFIAALSNSGIPPTFGFVGKDLAYAATLDSGSLSVILTTMLLITNGILFYAGFIVGVKPFFAKKPQNTEELTVRKISPILWLPTLILSAGSLVFGIFPNWIHASVLHSTYSSVTGFYEWFDVALWHGFNLIFVLSLITIALGAILYFLIKPSHKREAFAGAKEYLGPKGIFLKLSEIYISSSKKITNILQNGNMRSYLRIIVVTGIFLLGYSLRFKWSNNMNSVLSAVGLMESVILIVLFVGIVKTVYTRSRLTAIVAMAVVGYTICLIYVFYSAPDLAMTQFSIDTLTIILFVLILHKLPKYVDPPASLSSRWKDGILSGIFGVMIVWIAMEVLQTPDNTEISEFYAENAYSLAKGKNVVNVILVDFRGFDTFMEITVLTIAAIGVFALTRLNLKENYKD